VTIFASRREGGGGLGIGCVGCAKFGTGAGVVAVVPVLPRFRCLRSVQVLYHLFIGVDMIYLYDNEDEPTYHRLFSCNPRVRVIHFPNRPGAHGIQVGGSDTRGVGVGKGALPTRTPTGGEVSCCPCTHSPYSSGAIAEAPPLRARADRRAAPDTCGYLCAFQILAQQDFMARYKDQHTWAMLPNLDEFIVLKQVRLRSEGCASLLAFYECPWKGTAPCGPSVATRFCYPFPCSVIQ
jgi:hypothetical protein